MDNSHAIKSIGLKQNPTLSDRALILQPLLAFNEQVVGPYRHRDVAVLVSNADGEVVGGLWGRTGWDHLFVELFYLPEEFRGRGIGRRIIEIAEAEAVRRGCGWSWLDTYDFQAPEFYEKLGYRQFGEMPDHPQGHRRIFFRKWLEA